jgi:hypothetical protein
VQAVIVSATYVGTVTDVYISDTVPDDFNIAIGDTVIGAFSYDTNAVEMVFDLGLGQGTGYQVPSTGLLRAEIGSWAWISGGEPDFIVVRNDRTIGGEVLDELHFEVRRGASYPYEDSKAYHDLWIKDLSAPLSFLSNELLPVALDITQMTDMRGSMSTGDPYTPYTLYSIEYQVNLASLEISVIQIPEPATLALFGLGLAGIGVMRRKKLAA